MILRELSQDTGSSWRSEFVRKRETLHEVNEDVAPAAKIFFKAAQCSASHGPVELLNTPNSANSRDAMSCHRNRYPIRLVQIIEFELLKTRTLL